MQLPDIAIIGLAHAVPGGGDTDEALWDLYARRTRPCSTRRFPGSTVTSLLLDRPPPAGWPFGIGEAEAARMSGASLRLLEHTWRALEDAGLRVGDLRDSTTGVWVGSSSHDALVQPLPPSPGARATTSVHPGALAARVSERLGLRGPSMTVDTLCSSSFNAMYAACRALQVGDVDLAIVAGIQEISALHCERLVASIGALSPQGRTQPFAADADGYQRAEGCGVLVLERAEDAARHRRRQRGQLIGIRAAHASGAHLAQLAPAELARLIRAALADAGLAPDAVDAVEAHGSGTRVGDAAEVAALREVFGASRERPLAVGSSKATVGGSEGASGIAGLVRVILALEHQRWPGLPEDITPMAELTEGPVQVYAAGLPWPRREDRRVAGVLSIGLAGASVFALVAEAPARPAEVAADGPAELALSAHDPAGLAELGRLWADFLGDQPVAPLARALAHQRTAQACRAVVSAPTRAALQAALVDLRPGASPPHLPDLLRAWLHGEPVELRHHFGPAGPTVALPLTPVPRPTTAQSSLADTLRALPRLERERALRAEVRARVAGALGVAPSAVDAGRGLLEQGLDSLQAVDLADTLARDLCIAASSRAVLEHGRLDPLAAWLSRQLEPPVEDPDDLDHLDTGALAALLEARLAG